MPEETKKEEKLVDIDTTGPGADVELPEEKEKAVVTETAAEPEKETNEEVKQDDTKPADTSEKLDESVDVRDGKDDQKQDEKLDGKPGGNPGVSQEEKNEGTEKQCNECFCSFVI